MITKYRKHKIDTYYILCYYTNIVMFMRTPAGEVLG